MAWTNNIKPSGLSPVSNLGASKWNGQVNLYSIPATDTNAYYPGDLVKLVAANADANGVPGITLGTAGATSVGVVVAVGLSFTTGGGAGGPQINPNNLAQTWRPAAAQSTPWYALVADDPGTLFEIMEGSTGTNLTNTIIGEYASILYAAPATGVYVSGTVLNNTTVSATPGVLNLKIMRLKQSIDNHFVTSPSTGGGGQRWIVKINNHSYNGVATAGV